MFFLLVAVAARKCTAYAVWACVLLITDLYVDVARELGEIVNAIVDLVGYLHDSTNYKKGPEHPKNKWMFADE